MKAKETKSKYQVPNLERALKIIEHLAGHPECSTMAEISRVLGYPNNSVFRIVSSLESNGYLVRNPQNKHFRISRKLLSIGYQALVETSLVEKSLDILRSLRDETGESALVGTLLEKEGVVLDQVLSHEPIKFMVSPGTRFSLYTAAPAKAILAFADKHEFEHQTENLEFSKLTDKTVASMREYKKVLKIVREKGYAVDLEEEAAGIMCVSAPIFDYRGIPTAAIWITGPKFRIPASRIPELGEIVVKHAVMLSKHLGYDPASK
ncbi:MAG: IclR family transcriptional regulator [Victivallaceae bacterium]|nr:IclR family transcriptional regulator [Victivallaceae bacterium]